MDGHEQKNWFLTRDSTIIGTGETESSAAILTDADEAKVLGVVRVQPTGHNRHCLFLYRKHDGPEHGLSSSGTNGTATGS